MVASQGGSQETHNDMYCSAVPSPYGVGEFYHHDSHYYMPPPGAPEMCPQHHPQMCTVHGDYGKIIFARPEKSVISTTFKGEPV